MFIRFLMIIFREILSLVLLPVILWEFIYDWIQTIKWRKNVKIGDMAWFPNMLGTRTIGKVKLISENKKEVCLCCANSSSWHDIKDLRFYTKRIKVEELERLRKLLMQ